MSITINRRVGTEKLWRVVPRQFSEKWRGYTIEGEVTVVTFDDRVVSRSTAERAVRKAKRDDTDRFLFVGRDFTQEARIFLEERVIPLIDLQHFGWTDSSHESIRVEIGAKVKRPIHPPQPTQVSSADLSG